MKPEEAGIVMPEMKQEFPERLKKALLNAPYSCQKCEARFKVRLVASDGKKSKTWSIGAFIWGQGKDASIVEALALKCPGCGQPAQLIVLSKRVLLDAALQGAPHSEPVYQNKPTTPMSPAPRMVLKKVEPPK